MKRFFAALSGIIFIISCNNITELPTELPQVITTNPQVSDTAVIVGGEVTFTDGDNNTSRGVCWSTTTNPTTSDEIFMDTLTGVGPFSFDILFPFGSIYLVNLPIEGRKFLEESSA